MCQSVIIRPTIDYSIMADICFAGVWSRDKFPAKINKLIRDHIDLSTKKKKGWVNMFATRYNQSERSESYYFCS